MKYNKKQILLGVRVTVSMLSGNCAAAGKATQKRKGSIL